jgi:Protein of unknown function (DUF3500)
MNPYENPNCPECEGIGLLGRRSFLRTLGSQAAAVVALGGASGLLRADQPQPAKVVKPAEEIIRELFATLTDKQKLTNVLPWDFGKKAGTLPTRLGMYNAPIQNQKIADQYTKSQQELLDRIFRSICADEKGYHRLSRGGDFDASGAFTNIGAHIFGDPTNKQQFSLVFSGHHLTVRCDGNSEPDTAFGGPMYYGHTPDGLKEENVFFYQTQAVQKVYESLNEKQRKTASIQGTPGELMKSVEFRKKFPGLHISELSKDQKALVEATMRELLSPFRKEDADEVMTILKDAGGLDKIHLAFYFEEFGDALNWHFWRLEGPGFVWNFRVLPHVHTYVNIARVA